MASRHFFILVTGGPALQISRGRFQQPDVYGSGNFDELKNQWGWLGFTRLITRNADDEFVKWTGGRHLSFARLEGLQDSVQRLSAEVYSQYLLSFAPQETANKGLHRLIPDRKGSPMKGHSI